MIHKSADDIMKWVRGFVNEFSAEKNRNADRSSVSTGEQSALISFITILFLSIIIEVRIAFSDWGCQGDFESGLKDFIRMQGYFSSFNPDSIL